MSGLVSRSTWEAPHRRAIHPFPRAVEWPGTYGDPFTVVLHEDILTSHGNLVASAGSYEAIRQGGMGRDLDTVTIWSDDHYVGGKGIAVGVPVHLWSYPEEPPRGTPPHSCFDYARSGVAGGLYCGCCMAVLGE
jgi:hypothetical protein